MRSAAWIADEVLASADGVSLEVFPLDVPELLRRAAQTGLDERPDFAPADEPDEYRDLWEGNMPHLSGCIWLALPGEQPVHLPDELARHVLATLSEHERGLT